MKCLKCGKDTSHDQIFCDHCLRTMDAYPVDPGIHIQLPKRSVTPAPKKSSSRRRSQNPEETVVRLKKVTVWLCSIVLVLCLALGACIAALAMTGQALEEAKRTGKNFTVETTNTQ